MAGTQIGFGLPAARVVAYVARHGAMDRDHLAEFTGLSSSTVSRAVATLLEQRILRERPEQVSAGLLGRPGVPVGLDPDRFAVLGCHVGRRTTTVSLCDLAGRVVLRTLLDTPAGGPLETAEALAGRARQLLAQDPGRRALAVGLVGPWGDLDLASDALADALVDALGLEVVTGDHIAAIAAAELSARPERLTGVTAYVYARDTIGFAVAEDLGHRVSVSRVGRLSHLRTAGTRTCERGHSGCLMADVSDEGVAEQAHEQGIVRHPEIGHVHVAATGGSDQAQRLLRERAQTLGQVAAMVRDMVHPDRVVLVGQAFTGYPRATSVVLSGFAAATRLPPVEVSFTRFGAGVQAVAAGRVALSQVYADPLGAIRRAAARTPARPSTSA